MKTTRYINGTLLLATLATTVLLFASCNNRQKMQDTKAVAQERNEAKFDSNKQQNDAQFIVNAAEINLAQIQLGQLAQQRGRTMHVKELGKRMEEAYTKSQMDLTALASSKRISIPATSTDHTRSIYDGLDEKSGSDFDLAYADLVVSKHKDAIKAFEEVTTERYDTDINKWAIATLPALRTNLNHALDCQTKCKETKSK